MNHYGENQENVKKKKKKKGGGSDKVISYA